MIKGKMITASLVALGCSFTLTGCGYGAKKEAKAELHSGHEGRVNAVAFSPGGCTVASGSADNTVQLWRVTDGSRMRKLQGHKGWIMSVAFSPEGTTVASGSEDKTVRLWRVTDGRCLRELSGHTKAVTAVAFSPDGATLATGSLDDSIVFAGATAECDGFVRHQPRRGLAFRMDWPPISGWVKQPGRSRPTPPATVTTAP